MCHCPHLSDVLQHSDLVTENQSWCSWLPFQITSIFITLVATMVNEWYLVAQELPRKDFLMIMPSVTWTANTRLIGSIDLCCWTKCLRTEILLIGLCFWFFFPDYSCPISFNFSLLKPCIGISVTSHDLPVCSFIYYSYSLLEYLCMNHCLNDTIFIS